MQSGKWVGLVFLGLGLGLLIQQPLLAQSAGSNSQAQKVACSVNREPASEAQKALDRGEYKEAERLFQQMLIANSTDKQALTGLIRTLIEESKIDDALTRAEEFLTEQPTNTLALETMGEVRFRQGQLETAYNLAKKAVTADPCNARGYMLQGWYEGLVAMNAMSRRHLITAYGLDPEDKAIHAAWIGTLPHDEQIKAWTEFTSHTERFSEKSLASWKEYLSHAQDYKIDDCKIVSGMPIEKEVSVPLTPIPYTYFGRGLDVQLNGKIKRLEVNTFTNGIVLSKRVAASLGIVPGQKIVGAGIGYKGAVDGSIARVDDVRIGNMEFRNCNVVVLDKEAVSDDLEGMIGTNVFAKYLVTLDFPGQRLRVGPLPKRPENAAKAMAIGLTPEAAEGDGPRDRYIAPEMRDWSNVYREGRFLMLPTSIGGSSNRLFLVNTANGNIISTTAAREVTKVSKDPTNVLYTSKGPDKNVMMAGQFTWVFAGVGQKTDRMTSADLTDMSQSFGVEISGYIGAPILTTLVMHIDYRDNLIRVEPGH